MNARVLKQWGLWLVLPIFVLAVLVDVSPWPGSAEALIFIVVTFLWGIFVARPKMNSI